MSLESIRVRGGVGETRGKVDRGKVHPQGVVRGELCKLLYFVKQFLEDWRMF